MDKAVRWAICNVLTHLPLPLWPLLYPTTPTANLPVSNLVDKIPKGLLGLGSTVPKKDTNIFYIANEEGRLHYHKPNLAEEFQEAIQSRSGKAFSCLSGTRQ